MVTIPPPAIKFAPALVGELGALVVGLFGLGAGTMEGAMVGAEEGGPISEGQASPSTQLPRKSDSASNSSGKIKSNQSALTKQL